VLTNLIDCNPEELRIGQRVQAVFCEAGDSAALLRFRPFIAG